MTDALPQIHAKVLPGPAGSTRALVFMHGWGQTHASMLPMAELLGAVGTRYVLDLPGFGVSEAPPIEWDTFAYARRILAWLDERGIAQADLVGHSFGGRVSVQMGAHYPDRVRSIVLIGAAGLRPKRSFRQRARVVFSRWLGKLARMLPAALREPLLRWREGKFGSPDFRAAKEPLRSILSRVVAEDLQEQARQVRAPTFLLWGREDDQTPVDMAERYKSLIAGAELVVLEGQGHFPFLGGGAHQCAAQLKRFYTTVAP
ncbi:MAG: alpha/beta hydrolase [Pseudomonadota bacterium]|nr:alpha/beta hydrolase [Pseudomonadota bacterium]